VLHLTYRFFSVSIAGDGSWSRKRPLKALLSPIFLSYPQEGKKHRYLLKGMNDEEKRVLLSGKKAISF
jgi:hypothetical protein